MTKKTQKSRFACDFFYPKKATWGGIVVFPTKEKVEGGKKWDEFHYD